MTRYLLAVAIVGAFSSLAGAAMIGVTKTTPPDITSDFLTVTYNSTTHALHVAGFADFMDSNGQPPPDDYYIGGAASFTLDANVYSGGVATYGKLTISGTIAALGATSGTLLTGNMTQFGFDAGGNLMDFKFAVTGGDLASRYGSQAGVILNTVGGFTGSFGSNFSNTGSGSTDTFPVPEPATMLVLLGAAALGVLRRSRRCH